MKFEKTRRYRTLGPIGFWKAEKGGGAVLKSESSWTKISGAWISVGEYSYSFQFRRIP